MKKSILVFNGSRFLLAVAALGMTLQLSSCTSGGEQNDVNAVQDVESLDGASAIDGDDALLSDSLPEDALGTDTATMSALDEATAPAPMEDMTLDDPAMPEETAAATIDEAPSFDNSSMDDLQSDPMASMDSTSEIPADPSMDSQMDTSSMAPPSEEMPSEQTPEPAPARVNIPLQKVANTPWKSGSRWVNAIYFARPGDSLESISQMLYGEDRSDELARINPTYQSREPRPGDKVYYASARRPDDSSQIQTWFEENGVSPQIYVTKDGENIRELSKQLLGYDGAWKEVWSSNSVESKGEVQGGEELRYWASAPSPSEPAAPAANEMAATGNIEDPMAGLPPATDPQMPPQDQQASEDFPPPPPMDPGMDMAQNQDLPPPPMDPGMGELPPPPMDGSQAMNDLPPPPPPMDEMPPPPPPPVETAASMGEESQAMDEDTVMALGTIAAAAAGIAALLVVRRRRKQKELESQFDSTHVGT